MNIESIEMKIAKTAAKNWGQDEPTNLEEAKGITWGSEEAAIDGILSVLGIDKNEKQNLMNDIYTNDKISTSNAMQIKRALEANGTSKSVIDMLSVIHDQWVKNNPNKFLQPDRNKEYQFTNLMLLNWKEANSDLLFLKPIIEACNIKLDDKDIEETFNNMQKDYLEKNNISSHEDLVNKLSQGDSFYPALNGIETEHGGNISKLLQNPEIANKMARQIEERIQIKQNTIEHSSKEAEVFATERSDAEKVIQQEASKEQHQNSKKNYTNVEEL